MGNDFDFKSDLAETKNQIGVEVAEALLLPLELEKTATDLCGRKSCFCQKKTVTTVSVVVSPNMLQSFAIVRSPSNTTMSTEVWLLA